MASDETQTSAIARDSMVFIALDSVIVFRMGLSSHKYSGVPSLVDL